MEASRWEESMAWRHDWDARPSPPQKLQPLEKKKGEPLTAHEKQTPSALS